MTTKFLIPLAFFFFALPAQAGFHTGPLVPCGRSGTPDCTLCHLWQLADNVLNFAVFNLGIPLAGGLFVAAGIILMTSGGSQTRVTKAKSIFINVAIGLVIMFASWLVVDSVIKTLASNTTEAGRVVGAWSSFPSCQ